MDNIEFGKRLLEMQGQLLALSAVASALIAVCPETDAIALHLRATCDQYLRRLDDQPASQLVATSLARWRDSALLLCSGPAPVLPH